MKNLLSAVVLVGLCSVCANAQVKNPLGKLGSAAVKGVKSFTVSDAEVIGYANDYMKWMDANNPVCKTSAKDKGMQTVADRLGQITSAIPADLTKELNLNVLSYYVVDVNAFACANGDIRIFAALMDLMTDDEILAVIGHEIGHIANKDSKDGFVTALRISALRDATGALGGKTAAKLTNSQLGDLAEALGHAQYSQRQEIDADAYGYEFLKKCGKDPVNMASSLGVLLKLQEEAGSSQNSKFKNLFSSHPDLKKRIETLNTK
ncbi:MAG: M48 family metalloprotease [Holophagales bacterium]|nr:M48 family metalloprotease [Holophagales bacterium]